MNRRESSWQKIKKFFVNEEESGEWSWEKRILILGSFICAGMFLFFCSSIFINSFPHSKLSWLYPPNLKRLAEFTPFVLLAFFYGFGIWIIRTHDIKKRF